MVTHGLAVNYFLTVKVLCTGNPAILKNTGPVAFRPTITHGLACFLLFYPCLRSDFRAQTWYATAFSKINFGKKLGVKSDEILEQNVF